MTALRRGLALLGAIALTCGAATPTAAADSLTTEPSESPEDPKADLDNQALNSHADTYKSLRGDSKPSAGQTAPSQKPKESAGRNGRSDTTPVKVKNAPKKKKVEVQSKSCTDMGVPQCAAAQTGCMTDAGGRDAYRPPTITWVRVDGGTWQYAGLSCGPPTSVEVPGASGPVDVEIEAPPVPTLGQIQRAFRSLPFSKPSVTIQPKGQRTAKNLKTFYAAQWPDDDDLQPGEISKPVKLLSWNVEFKVAAKDYRYDYGDGSKSGWTTSTGGTYPDGDITHTYSETGDVEVKVDARLTGQYRVNGGEWQDIATVADLQDEPSFTLEVRGTKTTLVDN